MTKLTPPTKAEIKAKLNISDDDFEILTQQELPPPTPGQYLEPVGNLFGIPTQLLKTTKGKLLAVILLPVWGVTVYQNFENAVQITSAVYNALDIPNMPESQKYQYAIVTERPITLAESQSIAATGNFPAGSGIYPYPI